MSVAVIDYGSGNLRSVAKAVSLVMRDAGRDDDVTVTDDPDRVRQADRIILPGVGAFADCAAGLAGRPGLREVLQERVIQAGCPFLGICVGMQLLADLGQEHGNHAGLGWLPGRVVPLTPADPALKIPQMGWNQLEIVRPHPLLAGIAAGSHAYFVHGFHFLPAVATSLLATVDYGGRVAALVGRDNLAGTQFHPEKSQRTGLTLLANFIRWTP